MTPFGRAIFVKLFRRWSAACAAEENPLPAMHDLSLPFDSTPELALACASLFDLTEAHLGRSLVPECCCSQSLSSDEEALIGLLCHAGTAGIAASTPHIPHGLPGAIRWAALAVLRALDESWGEESLKEAPAMNDAIPEQCPFGSVPISPSGRTNPIA